MNGKRIRLSVVDSTNLHTIRLLGQSGIDEYTLVTTDYQEQGRGQRGKIWQSQAGLNLLSSIVVRPNLKAKDQFLISAATALLVIELLQEFDINAQVKWPNDILVNGQKIAGILIENQLKKDVIETAIIGLGLNVNQIFFDLFPWKATSLKLQKLEDISVDDISSRWQELISQKLKLWIQQPQTLIHVFNQKMFGLKQQLTFTYQDRNVEVELLEVKADGRICLKQNDQLLYFVNGEIKMLNSDF